MTPDPTLTRRPRCPTCGGVLVGREGDCPHCAATLVADLSAQPTASLVREAMNRSRSPSTTAKGPRGGGEDSLFRRGEIVADRYEMRLFLGRGGMGEVWLGHDLRLRVEVALKSLRDRPLSRTDPTDMLRREILAARRVTSPNVCRIFDLVEADGIELLSMEYIDGITLSAYLEEHSPLELHAAQEIAAQFLAGLEAIHAAGLVHRDLKPENVMITRTGRVVVMDLGLANPETLEPGSVAGTRPYMAPEQLLGRRIDRRGDVFAAGVVLAEMVHPAGVRDARSRERVWMALREQPPLLPESAWSGLVRRALRHDPEERYDSASALSHALEETTRRLGLVEEEAPYPGLAFFTEAQAGNFYGREVEIEMLWRKLGGPSSLLALIGPSGAGKSSLLRAGLIPTRPEGWRIVIATPGHRPLESLRRALAPEIAGDAAAIADLARPSDPENVVKLLTAWRRRNDQALLIIDQFEELFTLNPPEVQRGVSELLARLPIEADVHVLVSIRDDFLIRCHDQDVLAPLFSELTPLKPPEGDALRRALEQPASKQGYRFEDETLVEEILEAVSGERGALPLAAFLMTRLWEKRDRKNGLLTRAAYEQVGGVAGAVAQHAEAACERIGAVRIPIVRELFRNLVTGQGTRAAREREVLLSLFPNRDEAVQVLDSLIDARLLTSYEVEDAPPRIEVIHESLLAAWPRLVRWQAQDAEGAVFRDHFRQAAQLWEERGRPRELLWTASAYREFIVWRGRYPGALTAGEEAFAREMVSHSERRRRRTRFAVAAVLAIALSVTAVVTGLWRQSAAQSRRAEAQKLLALSQAEQERDPTAALAYLSKSLEINDTADTRQIMMGLLSRGPFARILELDSGPVVGLPFSQDGSWLAVISNTSADYLVPDDGGPARLLEESPGDQSMFSPDGRYLAIGSRTGPDLRVLSIPQGDLFHTIRKDVGYFRWQRQPSTESESSPRILSLFEAGSGEVIVRSLPIDGGDGVELGRRALDPKARDWAFDAAGPWVVQLHENGRRVTRLLVEMGESATAEFWNPEHEARLVWASEEHVATATDSGVEVWSPAEGRAEWYPVPAGSVNKLDRPLRISGTRIVARSLAGEGSPEILWVWDRAAPPDAEPQTISPRIGLVTRNTVHPSGEWIATSGSLGRIAFWPLGQARSHILRVPGGWWMGFTRDTGRLISCGLHGTQIISLRRPIESRATGEEECGMALDPAGNVAWWKTTEGLFLEPISGRPRRHLAEAELDSDADPYAATFDASGRLLAVYMHSVRQRAKRALMVFDLASGEKQSFPVPSRPPDGTNELPVLGLLFGADGALYSCGEGGIRRWDLATGENEVFQPSSHAFAAGSGDGRLMLAALGSSTDNPMTPKITGELVLLNLETGTRRPITTHGSEFSALALDETGQVIVTATDRLVRVGRSSGEEPHLLVGHASPVISVAVSPDGRWIATAGITDGVRLWPMPDLSQPPLHTQPHDALMAKLGELTNLRAVPDGSSAVGYRLEAGPFPGWRQVPTW